MERLTQPEKYWKFSAADLVERRYWKNYQQAYAEAMSATSTHAAPWYVIPADHKFVARAMVADIIVEAIHGLRLKYPVVPKERLKALDAARRALEGDGRKNSARKAGHGSARQELPGGKLPHDS